MNLLRAVPPSRQPLLLTVAAAIVSLVQPLAADVAGEKQERPATWTIPSQDDVRARVFRWIDGRPADAVGHGTIEGIWSTAAGHDGGAGSDTLDRVVASIAVLEPRAVGIATLRPPQPPKSADLEWLTDSSLDPFVRDSVRLHVARHLVRCGLFDDASTMLADLDLRESVDPATLLFLKATCQHWLLDADGAAATLERLLERSEDLPIRYERMATLMQRDLESLEDDSLDHISRRMRDITRRLSFGRAGPATRSVQDGVIESLDKLIAKLEEQQQQCQGGGGASGGGPGNGSGSKPMEDSMPAGGKGPGEVAKKDVGNGDGWGDLPPRKRDEALQQIGREFPPHYREAIEQYFKRLASGENATAGEPRPRNP